MTSQLYPRRALPAAGRESGAHCKPCFLTVRRWIWRTLYQSVPICYTQRLATWSLWKSWMSTMMEARTVMHKKGSNRRTMSYTPRVNSPRG
eukprot:4591547-Karenia_brevis.AAC.1